MGCSSSKANDSVVSAKQSAPEVVVSTTVAKPIEANEATANTVSEQRKECNDANSTLNEKVEISPTPNVATVTTNVENVEAVSQDGRPERLLTSKNSSSKNENITVVDEVGVRNEEVVVEVATSASNASQTTEPTVLAGIAKICADASQQECHSRDASFSTEENKASVDLSNSTLPNSDIAVPQLKKGYVLKQGHLVKNWKKRYFVLEKGNIAYYERSMVQHPYGLKKKGEMSLSGATVNMNETYLKIAKELTTQNTSGKNSNDTGHSELMLDFKETVEQEEWLVAIQEHIQYLKRLEEEH